MHFQCTRQLHECGKRNIDLTFFDLGNFAVVYVTGIGKLT